MKQLNQHFFAFAFGLGAAAILWVAYGFVGTQWLALGMTLAIAAVYALGALELRHYRQASANLGAALQALATPPAQLDDWLAQVPPSLRNTVHLRLAGERSSAPAPALTPYLVGLLVMLGMLGTFLGMVVTLNGAAFSLQGSTDLQTIRSALAAPIKGLGLAFGTSVAGVAASAMLGLMSSLSRRDRVQVLQQLEHAMHSTLRSFSLAHQRQQAYLAMHSQAQTLPALTEAMHTLMTQVTQVHQTLGQRLETRQDQFHQAIEGHIQTLARSVDTSLKSSLIQSVQHAGDVLQPMMASAMAALTNESRALQQHTLDAMQVQMSTVVQQFDVSLGCLHATFDQNTQALLHAVRQAFEAQQASQAESDLKRQQAWGNALAASTTALQQQWELASAQTLAQQQQIADQARASADQTLAEVSRLMTQTDALMHARLTHEAQALAQHSTAIDQLAQALRAELAALREAEAQRGAAAVARLGELQSAVAEHLSRLGTALEAPIARLVDSAAQAPRAAAEVIAQMRQQMSTALQHDNALLQERSQIADTLRTLLADMTLASSQQRAQAESLVSSTAAALQQASGAFATQLAQQADHLTDVAAHVTSGAIEVASLGEALAVTANTFQSANQKLIESLQRIEAALDKSMTRSDEQLAYTVAQAREVVALSVMSQKEVFESLRQLSATRSLAPEA